MHCGSYITRHDAAPRERKGRRVEIKLQKVIMLLQHLRKVRGCSQQLLILLRLYPFTPVAGTVIFRKTNTLVRQMQRLKFQQMFRWTVSLSQ